MKQNFIPPSELPLSRLSCSQRVGASLQQRRFAFHEPAAEIVTVFNEIQECVAEMAEGNKPVSCISSAARNCLRTWRTYKVSHDGEKASHFSQAANRGRGRQVHRANVAHIYRQLINHLPLRNTVAFTFPQIGISSAVIDHQSCIRGVGHQLNKHLDTAQCLGVDGSPRRFLGSSMLHRWDRDSQQNANHGSNSLDPGRRRRVSPKGAPRHPLKYHPARHSYGNANRCDCTRAVPSRQADCDFALIPDQSKLPLVFQMLLESA